REGDAVRGVPGSARLEGVAPGFEGEGAPPESGGHRHAVLEHLQIRKSGGHVDVDLREGLEQQSGALLGDSLDLVVSPGDRLGAEGRIELLTPLELLAGLFEAPLRHELLARFEEALGGLALRALGVGHRCLEEPAQQRRRHSTSWSSRRHHHFRRSKTLESFAGARGRGRAVGAVGGVDWADWAGGRDVAARAAAVDRAAWAGWADWAGGRGAAGGAASGASGGAAGEVAGEARGG